MHCSGLESWHRKTSQQHTMKKVGVQIQMGVCRSFSCLLLLLCPVSPSTWPSLLLILHCVSTRHLIIHWKRKIRFATRVFLLNLHSRLGGAVQGRRGEKRGLYRMAWIQPQNNNDENTIKCKIWWCVSGCCCWLGPLCCCLGSRRGGNKYDRNHLIIFIVSFAWPPLLLLLGFAVLVVGHTRTFTSNYTGGSLHETPTSAPPL